MILQVLVHEADIQDYAGGKLLLEPLGGCFPRLKLIWVDSAYKKGGNTLVGEGDVRLGGGGGGAPMDWPAWRLGVLGPQRTPSSIRSRSVPLGFHVLKWRWIVERTFAWLSSLPSTRQGP